MQSDERVILQGGHVEHQGMPRSMTPVMLHAIDSMEMAAELCAKFEQGRQFAPGVPFLIWTNDNATPVVYYDDPASGIEIAQVVDEVMDIIGWQQEQIASGGRGADYDLLREQHGQGRREDAAKRMQNQLQQRIAHHLANPVTDPFRQPRRTLGNIFPMSRAAGWHTPGERSN